MNIKCKSCGYVQTYNGLKKVRVQCNDCGKLIYLDDKECIIDDEQQGTNTVSDSE